MTEEFRQAIQALLNSADDTGCTDDLIVVSKSALQQVERLLIFEEIV